MTSVLIVNWNTRDFLAGCLASLPEAFGGSPYEVVVVDNGSADGSGEMVRSRYPETRLLALGGNAGYAAANNLAAREAKGSEFLFLNPDTRLHPGSVPILRARLVSDSRIAIVAPRLLLPDGSTQASCRGYPSPLALASHVLGVDRLFPKSRLLGGYRMRYMNYEAAQPVPQPMASCWLMSRSAWEDVGEFDERFPIFFNDVDWCYRAARKGYAIWYEPAAAVDHVGGASTRQVRPQMIWESHWSLLRYYCKHLPGGAGCPVYWMVAPIAILGAFLRAKGWHAGFRPDRYDR